MLWLSQVLEGVRKSIDVGVIKGFRKAKSYELYSNTYVSVDGDDFTIIKVKIYLT
jgi:hypothetical protein